MKHLALGWACNLNDIFVRFPYEKCKSLMSNFKTKLLRRQKVKQVFREGVQQILNDVIYIVREPSTNDKHFLSFYLGLAQVTDLININDVVEIPENVDFSNIVIPASLPIQHKLYTLVDEINNVIRVYGCDEQLNTLPLCGLPIWED